MFDFDLSYFPATIDMLHGALALVAIIELFLLLFLLTVVVIALVRRSSAKPIVTAAPSEIEVIRPKPEPAPKKIPKKSKPAPVQTTAPVVLREATPDAALQLLGVLQQEARFIDFIEEDIGAYADADIGAAVRVVHEGCHKVLHEHFDLAPVRDDKENKKIKVSAGFNPAEVRLTGNIVGEAPFNGTLIHKGWRVTKVKLPKLAEGHDARIIAPAEVEL